MRKILESSPVLLVFSLMILCMPNSRGWFFYLYMTVGSFLILVMVAKPYEYLQKQEDRIQRLEEIIAELNRKINKE